MAALALSVLGCGSKQGAAADPVISATERLQGRWKVRSFTPEAQLDAPLQGFLNAQLGALIVTFTGADYVASGPGIDVSGRFKIWSAGNDQLSGTVYDQTNVAYRISGQFQGPLFQFRSFDPPWRGQGELARAE